MWEYFCLWVPVLKELFSQNTCSEPCVPVLCWAVEKPQKEQRWWFYMWGEMLEMSRKLEAGNFQSLVYLWAWAIQVCEDTEYSHIFACPGLSFWHCWDPVKPIITRILTGHEPKPFVLMMAPCSHSRDSGPTANWRCGIFVLNSLGKIFWIQLFHVALHCTSSSCTDIREVSRAVPRFVPPMHIKWLGCVVLLSLTAVPSRVFVSTILYAYLFKWKNGFANPLSIFYFFFCHTQCPSWGLW